MGEPIPCRACSRGVLYPRKLYRLGGAVAVLGFVIGVPSFLGLAFAAILLWATGKATVETAEESDRSFVRGLVERGVPEATAHRVVAGPPLSSEELEALPEEQRRLIQRARELRVASNAGVGIAATLGGGTSLCIGAASLVGVLLAALLTLTRRVLQCGACGVTLAAG